MRKFYLLFFLLLAAGTMSAQEKLSKEEQARRKKNIDAANPFKQFGSKAKVATLSKGRYVEVHDLDSIVTIGSIKFNVDKKEIVGNATQDTINGEYARPIGDMPSRWLSPDPLSEEFTSWSPYSFVFNNPLKFNDPTGMAPEIADFKPDKNGNLIVEKGDNAQKLKEQYGVAVTDKNFKFKEGNVILLDNNATRAIAKSNGGSVDEINSGKAKMDVKNDNYICDECAQMANAGEEITPANATKYGQFPDPSKFDSTPGYSPTDSFDGTKIGEGIASIGGQHTVSFYGTSNNGTVYVLSKDGRAAKPHVSPLTDVIKSFNKDQNTNFTTNDVRYFKKDAPK